MDLSFTIPFLAGLVVGYIMMNVRVNLMVEKARKEGRITKTPDKLVEALRKITMVQKIDHAHKLANRAITEFET